MSKQLSDFLSGVVPADLARQIIELVDGQDEWISVDDELPVIPKRGSGIIVDVWVEPKRLNALGNRITDVEYSYHIEKADFIAHGVDLTDFLITHWKYKPKPPKDKDR